MTSDNRPTTERIKEPSWVIQYAGSGMDVVTPLKAWRLEGSLLISNGEPYTVDISQPGYTVWRVELEGEQWVARVVNP